MATRKKTKASDHAATYAPLVVEPKTAKGVIENAVNSMVGKSTSFSRPISALKAVAGKYMTEFSGGQDFERLSYSFTYRHPATVISTHRAVFLKKDFKEALASELENENESLVREVASIVTSRALDAMVLKLVEGHLADMVKWMKNTYYDLDRDAREMLYQAVESKSLTSYSAYDRRRQETIELAEYPAVYSRFQFLFVKAESNGGPRVASDGNIVVDYKIEWDVESKRWSFDSEDIGSY
jgi:hypothetical protein